MDNVSNIKTLKSVWGHLRRAPSPLLESRGERQAETAVGKVAHVSQSDALAVINRRRFPAVELRMSPKRQRMKVTPTGGRLYSSTTQMLCQAAYKYLSGAPRCDRTCTACKFSGEGVSPTLHPCIHGVLRCSIADS